MHDSFFSTVGKTLIMAFMLVCLTSNISGKESDETLSPRNIPMSFRINYNEASTELCHIGAYYDTDKSSQRKDCNPHRHCHPYTLFYHSLFKEVRNDHLTIGEIGILYGASLLMWRDYFPNAAIYGFDYDPNFIRSFNERYANPRIALSQMDVHNRHSIAGALSLTGVQYDLIIEDSTHNFEDQIRVIEIARSHLKPGGMLIIEDIFKSANEQDYINRLANILDDFQDYYFITLDHKNRYSEGWNNDKLFVLVKSGATPIFKNTKKLTIITPSIRPQNLRRIRDSIDFNYVDEWIIVYDGNKIHSNPNLFISEKNSKISEYVYKGEGKSGNPQRNYALDHVRNENTYLYFLDDDNLVHKDLYKLLNIIDDSKMYTFDQKNRLAGNCIRCGAIDTAMLLIDFKLCKNVRWTPYEYAADFYYINDCHLINKDKWIYVNNDLCTYNVLPP